MGACSIEGGNVGGIPDRQQRSHYFDPPEQEQEQTQVKAKPVQVETQATDSENPKLVAKKM